MPFRRVSILTVTGSYPGRSLCAAFQVVNHRLILVLSNSQSFRIGASRGMSACSATTVREVTTTEVGVPSDLARFWNSTILLR